MNDLLLYPHDLFVEYFSVLVELFRTNEIELFFDFFMIQYQVKFLCFVVLCKVGIVLLFVGELFWQFLFDLVSILKEIGGQGWEDGVFWEDVFLLIFEGSLKDGYLFLFSFLLDGDEPFLDFFIDLDLFINGDVFFFYFLFEVVPLGFDAFVELFCFFEDGGLEHVEGLAVFYHELEIVVDFFGILILALFEFVIDGGQVHGVLDFLVVALDERCVDWLPEDL